MQTPEPAVANECEHVWRLIKETTEKHPGYTGSTYRLRRRYFCERCLAKFEEADDAPIYR